MPQVNIRNAQLSRKQIVSIKRDPFPSPGAGNDPISRGDWDVKNEHSRKLKEIRIQTMPMGSITKLSVFYNQLFSIYLVRKRPRDSKPPLC